MHLLPVAKQLCVIESLFCIAFDHYIVWYWLVSR